MDDWCAGRTVFCTGELWLNEQRIDMLPTAERRLAFFSRMHCYLTSSASGKITAGATGDT